MKKIKKEDWEERFDEIMSDSSHEIGVGPWKEEKIKDFIRSLLKEQKEQKTEEICSKCKGLGWVKVTNSLMYSCECKKNKTIEQTNEERFEYWWINNIPITRESYIYCAVRDYFLYEMKEAKKQNEIYR